MEPTLNPSKMSDREIPFYASAWAKLHGHEDANCMYCGCPESAHVNEARIPGPYAEVNEAEILTSWCNNCKRRHGSTQAVCVVFPARENWDFIDRGSKKNVAYNLCVCGCETPCKGLFAPGHDQRVLGWIRRAERNQPKAGDRFRDIQWYAITHPDFEVHGYTAEQITSIPVPFLSDLETDENTC